MRDLEKIDYYIYKKLVSILIKMVPEYKTIIEHRYSLKDLPNGGIYLFMNEFATYLSNEIKKNTSPNLVKKSFKFINTLGESHNLEIFNIVKVGILEILYTEERLNRTRVKSMLSTKLQTDFDTFSKYYN